MEKQQYWRNSSKHWGIVSRFLHWGMAFLVVGMLASGFYMASLAPAPFKFFLYGLHKAIGVGILGLLVFRLTWRLSQPVPKILSVSSFHQFLSKMSVPVLYTVLFLMPISGICMSQAAGYPIPLWKEYTLIQIIDKNPAVAQIAAAIHYFTAWLLITVLILHTFAAFYHHFYLKDSLLKRMWTKP